MLTYVLRIYNIILFICFSVLKKSDIFIDKKYMDLNFASSQDDKFKKATVCLYIYINIIPIFYIGYCDCGVGGGV